MEKSIVFCVLIILGLFVVYMINNKTAKQNPAVEETLNIAPLTSSPSPTQTVNLTPSPTSSQTIQNTETNANTAIIKTAKGDIELSLYVADAPNTVANFVAKVKSGFYNNLTFHRVEDWVIQGGDPLGTGTGGGNMPVEFNTKPFVVGSLGVASRGDGKVQNDAQFFITKKDSPFLNGKYTNFGIVTKGMEIVNKIEIGDKILEIQLRS